MEVKCVDFDLLYIRWSFFFIAFLLFLLKPFHENVKKKVSRMSTCGDRYSYSCLTLSSLLFLWTESKKGKRWGCNSSVPLFCLFFLDSPHVPPCVFQLQVLRPSSPSPSSHPKRECWDADCRCWGCFLCFVSHFDSADWLPIAPPYLMRGSDSVFFSPQLKHYRQTHSFII